jgi:hypothetical protein
MFRSALLSSERNVRSREIGFANAMNSLGALFFPPFYGRQRFHHSHFPDAVRRFLKKRGLRAQKNPRSRIGRDGMQSISPSILNGC